MNKYRQWFKVAQAAMQSQSTQCFYDNISDIYDDVFTSHKIHAENIAGILKDNFSRQISSVSVLDLGCGTGMLSVILAKNGCNVIGMDISLSSIYRLKQKTFAPEAFQADVDFLPIQSKSLDAVVCLGSWRHFKNIERVVTEISRVLNLKGVFIVGYFPPAIAGIINVNQNLVGQILCWCYGVITQKLGYWDRTDCSFLKETEEFLQKQFKDVREVVSGKATQLVIARLPRSSAGELVPAV